MKKGFLLGAVLLSAQYLSANVSLPKIFSDNMVLQRRQSIPVWGWAGAGEKVTVQFNKQVKTIKAGKDGQWKVTLDAEQAGGPFQLVVKGKNQLTISNVLVGEVWICSGQSNMEWQLNAVNNTAEEVKQANYPEIRHYKVPNTVATTPQKDVAGGEWQVCSPATAANFTAVGYFFARELYNQLHVPIGLLNTTWGGTMVETWTSKEAFAASEEFKTLFGNVATPNIDSLVKAKAQQLTKKVESLQGPLDAKVNTEKWKDANFDDANWPHMQLPSLWENAGLPELDGIVWFRKTITLGSEVEGKAATLELGKIDDNDETYINGVQIGATTGYDRDRRYSIPAGVLKAGKNTIAVKVIDGGGGGGIYGEPGSLKLTAGSTAALLAGDWQFKIEQVKPVGPGNPNSFPTLLYNSMVSPLIPFAFKGVIWYQGEANADRAYQYRKAFPLLINDWRQQWKQGDFPFYFVQLASWDAAGGNSQKGSSWAELREAQTQTLSLPNTGMAVTIDIGESKDIHPRNKQDVGKRLAAIALNNLYEKPGEYSGPAYQAMQTNGNKIVLQFTHAANGFAVKDKYGYIKGFEVAGADHQFHFAKAEIQGDKIVVYSEKVSSPVAVRYAWADDAPEANLYNKEGFPALPFRTDTWKGITEEVRYKIQ